MRLRATGKLKTKKEREYKMSENQVMEDALLPQNRPEYQAVSMFSAKHYSEQGNGFCAEAGCGKKIEKKIREEFPQTRFCRKHQRTKCRGCGTEIPLERRRARNDVEYCIACQVDAEKKGMN